MCFTGRARQIIRGTVIFGPFAVISRGWCNTILRKDHWHNSVLNITTTTNRRFVLPGIEIMFTIKIARSLRYKRAVVQSRSAVVTWRLLSTKDVAPTHRPMSAVYQEADDGEKYDGDRSY